MQTANGEGYYRALFSASVTLTLAILGRSEHVVLVPMNLVAHWCTEFACALLVQSVAWASIHASSLQNSACSSMLPVPYAFSKTGVLLGVLVMLVVAGSNCLTSLLLLKAAGKTGRNSYEGVALAVGGQKWKVHSSSEGRSFADFCEVLQHAPFMFRDGI